MSSLATFFAIVASLIGIILLGIANFEGDGPKEDVCNFTLLAEVDGYIIRGFIKIDALGKDRAIVRWAESETILEPPHLRFSVVDFSDCRVTTTKISPDLTELMQNKQLKSHSEAEKMILKLSHLTLLNYYDQKSVDVRRASVDAEGVASKLDTWLTYTSKNIRPQLHFFPLSKGKGHLFVAIEDNNDWLCRLGENCRSMTVALVQPNGQRQNLTRIEGFNFYSEPLVSLANGMIGICAHQNSTTVQCTQFRLGDKEIKWFSTNVIWQHMSFRLKTSHL